MQYIIYHNYNLLQLQQRVWPRKPEITAVGIICADHATPSLSAKVGTNFADKRRSLGRCSSLAD
jgi:hypothetical protein